MVARLKTKYPPGSDAYWDGAAVVTSDVGTGDASARISDAIYFGGAGSATVILASGASIVLTAVPVGSCLKLRAVRVAATGTTSTLMVFLYNDPS